jgi:DNA-binding XRE family transcriptional regulator
VILLADLGEIVLARLNHELRKAETVYQMSIALGISRENLRETISGHLTRIDTLMDVAAALKADGGNHSHEMQILIELLEPQLAALSIKNDYYDYLNDLKGDGPDRLAEYGYILSLQGTFPGLPADKAQRIYTAWKANVPLPADTPILLRKTAKELPAPRNVDDTHTAASSSIKERKKAAGLTTKTLSEMSGLSPPTVDRAISGKQVSVTTARRLCAALELPLEDVFSLHEKPSLADYHRLRRQGLEPPPKPK